MMREDLVKKVSETLVKAGSTFSDDKIEAYKRAIENETNKNAKWVMEAILENAQIAEKNASPLCDDTGIPHVLIEIGPNKSISGDMIEAIEDGVRNGLRKLPGRPMAVLGDDRTRLEQSEGMDEDPGALEMAPILVRNIDEEKIKITVLMLGGGPALRGKTLRVFHKHDAQNVIDEIIAWATEASGLLGCTPCVLAVGIGRSQYEATSMMVQAMVDGRFDKQSDMEKEITSKVNGVGVGAGSLGGNNTVLATFMKVGPQRASGFRVVCLRTCCCFEPRVATVDIE